MKREFLEELGLDKGQTEAVMAENGRNIESLKLERDELTSRLSAAEADSQEFETVKSKFELISAENEKYAGQISALTEHLILKTTENVGFASSLARDAAFAEMKAMALRGEDISDYIKRLRGSDPLAFADGGTAPRFSATVSGNTAEGGFTPSFKLVRKSL